MPYCGNIAALQLFILGGATSLSIATLPWSSFFPASKDIPPPRPAKRNSHIRFGALTSALCGIAAIIINIGSSYTEDPVGLGLPRGPNYVAINSVLLFWSICLVTLASIQRYSSYLEEKTRDRMMKFLPKLVILWFLVLTVIGVVGGVTSSSSLITSSACVNRVTNSDGISVTCSNGIVVYPTQPANVKVLYILTGIVPILHIVLSGMLLYTEFYSGNPQRELASPAVKQYLDVFFQNSANITIAVVWLAYLLMAFCSSKSNVLQGTYFSSSFYTDKSNPALSESGLLGCFYLLFNSLVLTCEASITSDSLKLADADESENEDDENQRDIFFTTTNAAPQEKDGEQSPS